MYMSLNSTPFAQSRARYLRLNIVRPRPKDAFDASGEIIWRIAVVPATSTLTSATFC